MTKRRFPTLDELENMGYAHGFVFGKHTQQIVLDEKIRAILDNSKDGISAYMNGFNHGFKKGMMEASRLTHAQLELECDNEYHH